MITSNNEPREPEDWEVNVRTDLWSTMTLQQLGVQRDLLVTKISLMYQMSNANPTAKDILIALQRAHDYINDLINNKFEKQPTKRTSM